MPRWARLRSLNWPISRTESPTENILKSIIKEGIYTTITITKALEQLFFMQSYSRLNLWLYLICQVHFYEQQNISRLDDIIKEKVDCLINLLYVRLFKRPCTFSFIRSGGGLIPLKNQCHTIILSLYRVFQIGSKIAWAT